MWGGGWVGRVQGGLSFANALHSAIHVPCAFSVM